MATQSERPRTIPAVTTPLSGPTPRPYVVDRGQRSIRASAEVETTKPRFRVTPQGVALLAEIVGILLALAGVAGLTVAAWATDWRLGLTVVSLAALVGAFALTTTSDTTPVDEN